MVHADERPVGHDTGDARFAVLARAGDQVLHGGRVEELDVGEEQHLGQQGRGEERGVLDDDVVGVGRVLLVRDAQVVQEMLRGPAHDHGGEELAAEPGTTAFSSQSESTEILGGCPPTRSDIGLDDGDLQVRTRLGQHVGGAETAGAGADDDDVALGVLVQVVEVAAGHGARDLALADRGEPEVIPLAGELVQQLGLGALRGDGDNQLALQAGADGGRGRLVEGSWGRHGDSDGDCVLLAFQQQAGGREEGRRMILSLVLSRSSYDRMISARTQSRWQTASLPEERQTTRKVDAAIATSGWERTPVHAHPDFT